MPSSRHRVYRRGGGNDNQSIVALSMRETELHDPRRDLAAQPFQTVQSIGAGFRDLDALGRKVLAEELEMRRGLVELLRRHYRGEYRNFRAQLYLHERPDYRFPHVFVVHYDPGR